MIEVMVPQLRRLPPGQTAVPFLTEPARFGFDLADAGTRAVSSNHGRIDRDSRAATFSSIPFRFVRPSELDLMGRLAGLELRGRWAGWNREPFDHERERHVSIWANARRHLPPRHRRPAGELDGDGFLADIPEGVIMGLSAESRV